MIDGSELSAPICIATNTAAGKFAGNRDSNLGAASTPPAEAPTTTMSLVGFIRPFRFLSFITVAPE